MLVDVEALGQQRAHGLDKERVQVVGCFERRPGQPVVLRHVLAPHDLVHPLIGEIQGAQHHGELVRGGRRVKVGGGALQHGHVLSFPGYRRDQRRGRGAGADHDDPLAREIEVLGPPLGMYDQALETVHAFPLGPVRLGMVVVALAHPQEARGEPQLLPGVAPGDLDGPPAVLGGPARRGDAVLVADVLVEVVVLDDLVEVGEDLLARRDRRPAPRLEPVAVGEQVTVGAHTRVPMRPPGPAPVVLGVQDDEGSVGELVSQMVGGADTGDPGADDEDVDVTGVLDLLGALGGSGRGCSRRHDGPPGRVHGYRLILTPTLSGSIWSISWPALLPCDLRDVLDRSHGRPAAH